MASHAVHARAWILPAKNAASAAIIRRGPTQMFHLLMWDTRTGIVRTGDWFRGKIYPLRSDLSSDGRWMVFLAMTARGATFNGVCEPPWIDTVARWSTYGTWFGGGLWRSATELAINVDRMGGNSDLPTVQFSDGSNAGREFAQTVRCSVLDSHGFGEDEGVLYQRLERDGWRWAVPQSLLELRAIYVRRTDLAVDSPSVFHDATLSRPQPRVEMTHRPSENHPTLRMTERPYDQGRHFRFSLDELPAVLSEQVHWACFDAEGRLLVVRSGRLELWTLENLRAGAAKPDVEFDLNSLRPPGIIRDTEPN